MKAKLKLFLKGVGLGRALNFVHYILFKATHLNHFYDRGFNHLLSTGDQFDNKALWDELSEYYAKRFNAPPDTNYLSYLGELVGPKTRVLEFGCASGMNLSWLAHNSCVSESRLIGIDISDVAISIAKRRLREANLMSLDLGAINYCQTPFEEKVDLIFTRATLQLIEIQELRRIAEILSEMMRDESALIIKEAYVKEQRFSRVEGHRVFNTFNHNYPEIFNGLFTLWEHREDTNILHFKKCDLRNRQ